jgi:hypothetical protein
MKSNLVRFSFSASYEKDLLTSELGFAHEQMQDKVMDRIDFSIYWIVCSRQAL